MNGLARDAVAQHLLELLAYFASAARGNVDEAAGYGPYRLLEGLVRVTRAMRDLGLSDAELDALSERLVTDAMRIIKDPELARSTADEALALLAGRLRQAQQPTPA